MKKFGFDRTFKVKFHLQRSLSILLAILLIPASNAWSQAIDVKSSIDESLILLRKTLHLADGSPFKTVSSLYAGGYALSMGDIQKAGERNGIPLRVGPKNIRSFIGLCNPAILKLERPTQYVTLLSIGKSHALIGNSLVSNKELAARYTGRSLVFSPIPAAGSSIVADNPVRVVTITDSEGEIKQSVALTNVSSKAIRVGVAETSCGCTTAKLTSEIIQSHQSVTLDMRMKSDGWGAKVVTASLQTNDPRCPLIVVALEGNVPRKVVPNPTQLVFTARQGETSSRNISIWLPEKASVTSLKVRSPFLNVRLGELEPVPGGKVQHAQATLSGSAPAGKIEDKVTFNLHGAEVPSLSISMYASVLADVSSQPSQVFFGVVPLGDVARKTVVLQSSNHRAFSIKSIESSSKLVTAKTTLDLDSDAQAVEIFVDPKDGLVKNKESTALQEKLRFTLSDGNILEIPITASLGSLPNQISSDPGEYAPKKKILKIGEIAPTFSIADMNGVTRNIEDLRGHKNLLLTFFPKCFTGGCTNHLSSLRDVFTLLQAMDVEVWAVSVDPALGANGQLTFARQWQLPFPLIPDTDRKLCLLYGAAQQVSDLAGRMSVLIDTEGYIRYVDTDINVRTHGPDMLAIIQGLKLKTMQNGLRR